MIRSLLLCSALALASISTDSLAQKRGNDFPRASPNATVSQTIGVTDVTVTYGRPSVKGRKVFGDLEKFNAAWRAGANEATTITLAHDVSLQGKAVPAGTYSFIATPHNEKDWTISINSVANMWGAFSYDPSKDVAKIDVHSESAPMTEMLTYQFTDVTPTSATLSFTWGTTRVPLRIAVNSQDIIRKLAAEKTATTTDGKEYLSLARMAYSAEFMTEDGIAWAKKSLEYGESYDKLAITARLLARAGFKQDAVAYAERALKTDVSKKSEPPFWPALETVLVEWKKS